MTVPAPEGPSDAPLPERPRFAPLILRLVLVIVALGVMVVTVWIALSAEEGGTVVDRVRGLMADARESPWAPLVATGLLTVLNVAGVPLVVLTAGATAVFDDVLVGFLLSWTSSMIGATCGFFIGRWSGGSLIRLFGGERINAISAQLGQRGILACFLIRLVPTAPAIMVNMAIGASHIGFAKFFLGTGLGIAPKLVFIAVVTKGLIGLETHHSPLILGGLAALIVFWIATMVVVRRLVRTGAPR